MGTGGRQPAAAGNVRLHGAAAAGAAFGRPVPAAGLPAVFARGPAEAPVGPAGGPEVLPTEANVA